MQDEDFDSPEWNQPWDGKEPFMLGRCTRCKQVRGICCGQGDLEYCVECCDHPWTCQDCGQPACRCNEKDERNGK